MSYPVEGAYQGPGKVFYDDPWQPKGNTFACLRRLLELFEWGLHSYQKKPGWELKMSKKVEFRIRMCHSEYMGGKLGREIKSKPAAVKEAQRKLKDFFDREVPDGSICMIFYEERK